jgi:hypothetical protein
MREKVWKEKLTCILKLRLGTLLSVVIIVVFTVKFLFRGNLNAGLKITA